MDDDVDVTVCIDGFCDFRFQDVLRRSDIQFNRISTLVLQTFQCGQFTSCCDSFATSLDDSADEFVPQASAAS